MTDINKLTAEALVEQGYAYCIAKTFNFIPRDGVTYLQKHKKVNHFDLNQYEAVDPFSDTLESYRQLFALANYCQKQVVDSHGLTLWDVSEQSAEYPEHECMDEHGWMCNRVKWCFEQLLGESDYD